jgi:hypothetical protein
MLLFSLTCGPFEPLEPVYWPFLVLLGLLVVLVPYLAKRDKAWSAVFRVLLLQLGVLLGQVLWFLYAVFSGGWGLKCPRPLQWF